MKLLSNLTVLGLIASAPSKNHENHEGHHEKPEKPHLALHLEHHDPIAELQSIAQDQQNNLRIQLQQWQIGVASSDEIARRFLEKTENGKESVSPRNFNQNILRFKLLMGMMVWSHQSEGIIFHDELPDLGVVVSHEDLLSGIGFNQRVEHHSENELYAEMVMEHYHGYGCHCMPNKAHFLLSGGKGPAQDMLDVSCQMLRSCYNCLNENDSSCNAHDVSYNYDIFHKNNSNQFDTIVCTDVQGKSNYHSLIYNKHS